jgi:hypothetical protein
MCFLHPILIVTQTDVSSTEIRLDTSVLATINMGWREYITKIIDIFETCKLRMMIHIEDDDGYHGNRNSITWRSMGRQAYEEYHLNPSDYDDEDYGETRFP